MRARVQFRATSGPAGTVRTTADDASCLVRGGGEVFTLALTGANAAVFEARPQVKRRQPARQVRLTQLRGTFPRKRGRASALVRACGSRAAGPSPNVNMGSAET